MIAYVTAPARREHRAMLEAAAAGRCTLRYQQDGEDWLEQAQILIGETEPEELKRALSLQWFHLVWAGVDRYPKTVFPENVQFTCGSGAYGACISEHMLAGILALYRQLRHYERCQEQHIWDQSWQETTLDGKTVLILGTGDIGTWLAKRLRGFDCRVIGVRRGSGMVPGFHEMYRLEDLDRILPSADVVAGCLPACGSTAGLLNGRRLRSMKRDAVLVNCGRGNLIVTEDLERVLLDGHLAGCVLDVTDPEPLPSDSPLWDLQQVILTPHISGMSFGHVPEMEDRIFALAAENLKRYLDGKTLCNLVDFSMGYRKRS